MFDVNVWFRVSILIWNYIKSVLVYLAAKKIFRMMTYCPFIKLNSDRKDKRLMTAKMITYLYTIFTIFSLVTATNFNVTGVEYRLLTTLMDYTWVILRSYELDGSVISIEGKINFFRGRDMVGEFCGDRGGGGGGQDAVGTFLMQHN